MKVLWSVFVVISVYLLHRFVVDPLESFFSQLGEKMMTKSLKHIKLLEDNGVKLMLEDK